MGDGRCPDIYECRLGGGHVNRTVAVKNLLFDALRDAEDWQLSIADAWGSKTPEHSTAMKRAKKYKRMREKISKELGRPMQTKNQLAIESAETKTIHEIHAELNATSTQRKDP